MSTMRKKVVAIACSDIHLSLKPPVARAEEEDWMKVQERVLDQVAELSEEYIAPILCAGDVFDRWNSPPELINWAIDKMPYIHAIPGQHDLPLHNLDLINKSAYSTMTKFEDSLFMGIHDLTPGMPWTIGDVYVQGFPWGYPLTPPEQSSNKISIALIHRYIWTDGCSYPNAPKEARWKIQKKNLKGWDVVVFGDNHKGFLIDHGPKPTVFNCGSLMRRKSDEANYHPQVGLIYDDGSVEPHYLDCSNDLITKAVPVREYKDNMELKDFLDELSKLQDSQLDFEEAMKQVLEENKPSPAVRKLILEAMG